MFEGQRKTLNLLRNLIHYILHLLTVCERSRHRLRWCSKPGACCRRSCCSLSLSLAKTLSRLWKYTDKDSILLLRVLHFLFAARSISLLTGAGPHIQLHSGRSSARHSRRQRGTNRICQFPKTIPSMQSPPASRLKSERLL